MLLVLLFLLAGTLLYRLIQRNDNHLEWADLVATHGALNAYKIGYWIGAILGAWVIVKQTMTNHLDPSVFAAWLGFLAGVAVLSGIRGQTRDTPKHGVDDPDGGK